MYQIAVCDDEKAICETVRRMLESCKDVPTLDIRSFYTGEELCSAVAHGEKFDLFILDIELPQISGVDVGRKLRGELAQHTAPLLYISGKQKYGMQLFSLHVVDFLQKPLDEKKVHEALRYALKLFDGKEPCFAYQFNRATYQIAFRDIIYFESQNKNISIVTTSGQETMVGKLANIAGMKNLPASFIQVHQSFLINWDYVKSVRRTNIIMENGANLPVSSTYQKSVRDYANGRAFDGNGR